MILNEYLNYNLKPHKNYVNFNKSNNIYYLS